METQIQTIIETSTGKEICATIEGVCLETETLIPELRTEPMENPYFDFTTRTFYNKEII